METLYEGKSMLLFCFPFWIKIKIIKIAYKNDSGILVYEYMDIYVSIHFNI